MYLQVLPFLLKIFRVCGIISASGFLPGSLRNHKSVALLISCIIRGLSRRSYGLKCTVPRTLRSRDSYAFVFRLFILICRRWSSLDIRHCTSYNISIHYQSPHVNILACRQLSINRARVFPSSKEARRLARPRGRLHGRGPKRRTAEPQPRQNFPLHIQTPCGGGPACRRLRHRCRGAPGGAQGRRISVANTAASIKQNPIEGLLCYLSPDATGEAHVESVAMGKFEF